MPRPDRIRVGSERGGYDVLVGRDVLGASGPLLRELSGARVAALVSDTNVGPLYGARARASLESGGLQVVPFEVAAGEASKDWASAGRLLEQMAAAGLRRGDTLVVALGGGVVGDLAGFCASVYMRGVPVAQVPTTLLAQVDSAIGGKTGVDLPQGKNLAGTFWPPVVVAADLDVLMSLPADEWASGMAEVAKSAILDADHAVRALEDAADRLLARDPEAIRAAVLMAAGLKARVVSGDEREAAARESLNYGHTLGHAIERVAGYGRIAHGIAVAEGMRFAAALAEVAGVAGDGWRARQERVLDALGLAPVERAWDARALHEAMRADKKVRGSKVRFVLSAGPGSWEVREIDDATLRAALEDWAASRRGR